jgi:hypothetical protein
MKVSSNASSSLVRALGKACEPGCYNDQDALADDPAHRLMAQTRRWIMSVYGSDRSPATTALLIDHWRMTPPWQKLNAINELNESLKLLALSDLRRRHPSESDAQLQRRMATRWLGAELADRVYGPIAEGVDAAH